MGEDVQVICIQARVVPAAGRVGGQYGSWHRDAASPAVSPVHPTLSESAKLFVPVFGAQRNLAQQAQAFDFYRPCILVFWLPRSDHTAGMQTTPPRLAALASYRARIEWRRLPRPMRRRARCVTRNSN